MAIPRTDVEVPQRREVDVDLVAMFRDKYGPFKCVVVKNYGKRYACDCCGEPKANKIVKAYSMEHDKDLYVCLMCDGLKHLLLPRQFSVVMFSASATMEGLAEFTDNDFDVSAKEAKRLANMLEPSVDTPDPKIIANAVSVAAEHLFQGRGRHWRIIPELVSQHGQHGTLSRSQYEVIKKFNTACSKE